MSGKNTKGYWFACVDGKVVVDPALSPFDKAVFAVLCFHSDSDDRECYLKVETIAHEAGCSERSVQNSLKKLEGLGIIERKARFENNKQISSLYRIIGDKAPCYQTQWEAPEDRGAGDAPGGCTTCTQNESHLNDIKDSLTGEAPLPGSPEPEIPDSPKEAYTPEDAPDIMRPTAELFLHKTGRKTLTEADISALRELSAHQYPSRVQKEIDRACERFRRKGKSPGTLTLSYIAGALRNQPTLGRKSRAKTKPDPMNLTQAEIDAKQEKLTEEESLRELERLEAEMREEGC